MLTFLRKIRKSLIESDTAKKPVSPTGRYLLYAIGEIALVVIGILIALQINNWNEIKKNHLKEFFYLNALISELEENRVIAEGQLKYQKFQQANAEIVLDAYSKNVYPNDARDLVVAIEHSAWLFPTEFIANIWGELNSTGNLSLIQNDSLRQSLSSLYGFYEYVQSMQKEFNQFLHKYRDAIASVVDPYVRKEINVKMTPTGLQQELKPIDEIEQTLIRLKKVDKLDAELSNVIMKNEPLIQLFERMIRNIDELKKAIEEELLNA